MDKSNQLCVILRKIEWFRKNIRLLSTFLANYRSAKFPDSYSIPSRNHHSIDSKSLLVILISRLLFDWL